MKTFLLLSAAAFGLTAPLAFAQQGNPGAHFIENWDQNDDGIVTLAEVTERRDGIFASFDQDDDGFLSADDYILFDEARANDQANNHGGQGRGQGGQGGGRNSEGMTLRFNDTDGDGQVSRAEFMAKSTDWFQMIDRNGDGELTPKDFGRRS